MLASLAPQVCASTGVGAITNLSVPNWGSYYRPGFGLAVREAHRGAHPSLAKLRRLGASQLLSRLFSPPSHAPT